jgi:hypothetical protein
VAWRIGRKENSSMDMRAIERMSGDLEVSNIRPPTSTEPWTRDERAGVGRKDRPQSKGTLTQWSCVHNDGVSEYSVVTIQVQLKEARSVKVDLDNTESMESIKEEVKERREFLEISPSPILSLREAFYSTTKARLLQAGICHQF